MTAPKTSFVYYNVDTDRYQNTRIKRLKRALGCIGLSVYDFLLCEIYRVNGCYLLWDEHIALDVAEYFGLNENEVYEVVNYCCTVGLFNNELFSRESVLTSESIQERYTEMMVRAKRKQAPIPEAYRIIPKETERARQALRIAGEEAQGASEDSPPIVREEAGSVTDTCLTAREAQGRDSEEFRTIPEEAGKVREEFRIIPETFGRVPEVFREEKKSKEEENKKKKNKGNNTQALVFSDDVLYPVDFLRHKLGTGSWIEQVGLKLACKPPEVHAYFTDFCDILVLKGNQAKAACEFKAHFINWLRIQKEKSSAKKEKHHATGSTRLSVGPQEYGEASI